MLLYVLYVFINVHMFSAFHIGIGSSVSHMFLEYLLSQRLPLDRWLNIEYCDIDRNTEHRTTQYRNTEYRSIQ